jgi:hypothetical protein
MVCSDSASSGAEEMSVLQIEPGGKKALKSDATPPVLALEELPALPPNAELDVPPRFTLPAAAPPVALVALLPPVATALVPPLFAAPPLGREPPEGNVLPDPFELVPPVVVVPPLDRAPPTWVAPPAAFVLVVLVRAVVLATPPPDTDVAVALLAGAPPMGTSLKGREVLGVFAEPPLACAPPMVVASVEVPTGVTPVAVLPPNTNDEW